MGQLIAKRYPTALFLKAADHTYVECGTGAKGWSCWGGKSGGTVLNAGTGSTERADLIAEPNERAGITCYLINGVCHQAANRILLPAGILVMGARGYGISSAIFGAYGRPAGVFGRCIAPFNQHPGVTTDLPVCIGGLAAADSSTSTSRAYSSGNPKLRAYLRSVQRLYEKARDLSGPGVHDARAIEDFHVALFAKDLAFKLGSSVSRDKARKLERIRRFVEHVRFLLEQGYYRKELSWEEFVEEFNLMTIVFQHSVAGVLSERDYRRLFDLRRDEPIVLADPDIVKAIARQRPGTA